jgi:hypothetical protein
MKTVNDLHAPGFMLKIILALLLNSLAYGGPAGWASAQTGENQSQSSGITQSQTAESPRASAQPPALPMPLSGDQLPDSPGAVRNQSLQTSAQLEQLQQQPATQEQPQVQQQPQTQPPPQTQGQPQIQEQPETQKVPQNPSHEPVGTAAAEAVPTVGVAASRPSGAAMAPAKQRRVRSILIKTGAIIGVGVAVGTTMALSQASPGRPPGSH